MRTKHHNRIVQCGGHFYLEVTFTAERRIQSFKSFKEYFTLHLVFSASAFGSGRRPSNLPPLQLQKRRELQNITFGGVSHPCKHNRPCPFPLVALLSSQKTTRTSGAQFNATIQVSFRQPSRHNIEYSGMRFFDRECILESSPSTASLTGIPTKAAKSSPVMEEYAWATRWKARFRVWSAKQHTNTVSHQQNSAFRSPNKLAAHQIL